ncbi:hypothetical protein Esti_002773 [Eimeria stiedai]
MDLEQQSLQEHDQDQQQPLNEGPRRPRLHSVTLPALPGSLQGPLQGTRPLDLDLLPLHHEVLPQPDSVHQPVAGSAAPTLLVPPAPSSFRLLQQLQEEATNLNEGIAPLPIAPLPSFVGVPLPVTVETPQGVGDPSASVSLTVLQHPPGTHGNSAGARWQADNDAGFDPGARAQIQVLPQQHNRDQGAVTVWKGPLERPEGPLLSFLRAPRPGHAAQWPLSEGLDRDSLLALNSPASAPASVAARSCPSATAAGGPAPCVRSCVSAVGSTAYEEEPLQGPPGALTGPPGRSTFGVGLRLPASIVFLPGGPPVDGQTRDYMSGRRREEHQHVWNSGILGAQQGYKGLPPISQQDVPAGSVEAPGSWVAFSASALGAPHLPGSRNSATAPANAAGSMSAVSSDDSARGSQRWKDVLGWCRLLGALTVWFCLLYSAACLLQLKADAAVRWLQILAPVAAVLLFFSPAGAARRAIRDSDTRSLPAVACAVASVYGMQIDSKAILVTNATGFLAELCWMAVWASAQQQQNDSRPLSRPRCADGDSCADAPSWLRRGMGNQPSTAASPRNNGNSLQRRGPQRAPRTRSTLSTVSSPRPSNTSGGPSNIPPKGVPLAVPPGSKRPFRQRHNALAEEKPKGLSMAGGASVLSLNHNGDMNNCMNRMSSSNSGSEGTGDHSGNSNSPTQAGPVTSTRRRCSGSLRPRRRRGQQMEPRSAVCLSVALACARWFGLLLFLSAPLFLFLLLLPVALVGWLQVPASLCLFGAHVPRLHIRLVYVHAATGAPAFFFTE